MLHTRCDFWVHSRAMCNLYTRATGYIPSTSPLQGAGPSPSNPKTKTGPAEDQLSDNRQTFSLNPARYCSSTYWNLCQHHTSPDQKAAAPQSAANIQHSQNVHANNRMRAGERVLRSPDDVIILEKHSPVMPWARRWYFAAQLGRCQLPDTMRCRTDAFTRTVPSADVTSCVPSTETQQSCIYN